MTFQKLANTVSKIAGSSLAFTLAVGTVIVWAISGPIFQYSTNWQLVINTGTTIITFLMVFLLQNTQGRDATAMQIKLDELIRSTKEAHNALLDLEELEEKELKIWKQHYLALARDAREKLRAGLSDIGSPSL